MLLVPPRGSPSSDMHESPFSASDAKRLAIWEQTAQAQKVVQYTCTGSGSLAKAFAV